jgi:hypothetical protein
MYLGSVGKFDCGVVTVIARWADARANCTLRAVPYISAVLSLRGQKPYDFLHWLQKASHAMGAPFTATAALRKLSAVGLLFMRDLK